MKNILFIVPMLFMFLCSSCTDGLCGCQPPPPQEYQNKVLILKVDFTTNVFEAGKELIFPAASSFTLSKIYQAPANVGYFKLFYQELNQPLFDGTIILSGMGTISTPDYFQVASFFRVNNNFTATTVPVFENINNPTNLNYNYSAAWNSIKYIEKVNEYLATNPSATIKIFCYTPDGLSGNPTNWKWIIIVKN